MGEALKFALAYAKRGWHVIPLHTPVEDGCDCGKPSCQSVGKHPRTPDGLKSATADEMQIRRWWKQWPKANVGIVTGALSGIVVVDVDDDKGGYDTLLDLIKQHGPIPDTVEAITGGGGRHMVFSHPGVDVGNSAGKLGEGLDIRGDGGYIVAAPSLHKSGRSYAWEMSSLPSQTPLAALPGWLMDLLVAKPTSNGHGHVMATAPVKIPDGHRNDVLASLAGTMRRRGMTQSAILAALQKVNEEQCTPPLADDEVATIAASVARYAPTAPPSFAGSCEVKQEGDGVLFVWHGEKIGIGMSFLRERNDGLHGEVSVTASVPMQGADGSGHIHWARLNLSSTTARDNLSKFLAKRVPDRSGLTLDWPAMVEYACSVTAQRFREGEPFVDLATIARPARLTYLVDKLLPHGQTSVIYSKGASGKSLLALAIGLAVASGKALPGGLVPLRQMGVLYLDYEADEEEQALRLDFLCRGLGFTTPPHIICRHQTRPIAADITRLRAEVERRSIGLVIVDSIAYAIGGNALESDVVIEAFNALRSFGNQVARLVIAHIPKADKEAKQATIYGSVFHENAGRSVWEMQSNDEPEGFSVGLFQRKRNWGKKYDPIGLRFTFDDVSESVAIRPHDVKDDPELVSHGSLAYQLLAALRAGAMGAKQLCDETGANPDSVRKTLQRLEARGDIRTIQTGTRGRGNEATYGLAEGGNERF